MDDGIQAYADAIRTFLEESASENVDYYPIFKEMRVADCYTLNVREGPSENSKVLFLLAENSMVKAKYPFEGEWAYVTYEATGKSGYAMLKYLSEMF